MAQTFLATLELRLLIETITRKHQLGDTKAVGAGLEIGNMICELNTHEPRDLKYISELVIENGGEGCNGS